MELSEKQLAKLRETIYGGYNRSPLMTRGNRATDGADRFHKNAGQIDTTPMAAKRRGITTTVTMRGLVIQSTTKRTESLTGTTSSHMKSEISNGTLGRV